MKRQLVLIFKMRNWLSLIIVVWSFNALKAQSTDTIPVYTDLSEALKEPGQVVKLDLSKQKLTTFPTEIYQFTELQSLNLSKNKLKIIPDSIRVFVHLRELDLSRNKLDTLAPGIFDLKEMRHFAASQNDIRTVPDAISQWTELRVLDLWGNDIWRVSDQIGTLKKLRLLDLRVIQFTQDEQAHIASLLPKTKIHFSQSCNCSR